MTSPRRWEVGSDAVAHYRRPGEKHAACGVDIIRDPWLTANAREPTTCPACLDAAERDSRDSRAVAHERRWHSVGRS